MIGVSDNKNRGTGFGLYTAEQRQRRDDTVWTLVQGILAISTAFVVNFLANGTGLWIATVSVIAKTLILYAIMVTGAIWEKVVFGRYLFAPAFFWEDVVSMLVIALHTAYLAAWLMGVGTPVEQMWIALAAYGAYVINAAQFLLKFQQAKKPARQEQTYTGAALASGGKS